ncbi:MAG: methyltransferase domain-containing protein [Bacteroidota bacterium]
MSLPRTFSNEEIRNYYDHTQTHYRQFWKLNESMGLHYGIWNERTRSLAEAIKNTNSELANLGEIKPSDRVLDAGCGVGGSAIFLAKNYGCRVTGITLSERQVKTATNYAQQNGVAQLVDFQCMDYTHTDFPDQSFDIVWAIESMQTASDKGAFLKETARLLKPGGKLLVADVFKAKSWQIEQTPVMQTMLHGWAMSDVLSIAELDEMLENHGFARSQNRDVTAEIAPSIRRILWASLAGMVGTKVYNLFHRATWFSRIHYKTGIAQFRAWRRGLWSYNLLVAEKLN